MSGYERDAFAVYITAPSEAEARAIATELVNRRLAACINLLPGITSIFHWNGETQTASEAVLIVKTTRKTLRELIDTVKELHPYEVPAIIAWRIKHGNKGYLRWLAEETHDLAPAYEDFVPEDPGFED